MNETFGILDKAATKNLLIENMINYRFYRLDLGFMDNGSDFGISLKLHCDFFTNR